MSSLAVGWLGGAGNRRPLASQAGGEQAIGGALERQIDDSNSKRE